MKLTHSWWLEACVTQEVPTYLYERVYFVKTDHKLLEIPQEPGEHPTPSTEHVPQTAPVRQQNYSECKYCNLAEHHVPLCKNVSAQFHFSIRAVFLPGLENQIADCLSRLHLAPEYREIFYNATSHLNL